MKNTTSVFETYFNLQNQFVENIVETSKKVRESLGTANVLEKSVEAYNEWFTKQQELAEGMIAKVKEQANFEAMPSIVKEVVATQEEFGKSWLELVKTVSKSKTAKEVADIYSANLKKMQDSWTELYSEVTKSISNPSELKVPTVEDVKANFKKMIDMLKPVTSLN